MREVSFIVLHCTGTSLYTKVDTILRYWSGILGWSNPGYHFIIDRFGNVTQLLDIKKISNGVKGYNSKSIHIAWIGGKYEDNRTSKQKVVLAALTKAMAAIFPNATIQGHRDFPKVSKECPSFNVETFLNDINL